MNTGRIKAYAPQARREFIQAVTDKASLLGLTRDRIEPMEIKGDVAVINGKAFPKRVGELRAKLEERIRLQGFDQVMEAMAYTWFNRFVALRYMELHDYLDHGYRVLSNRSGSDIPEILEHAAEVDLPGLKTEKVVELRLAGDKDNELYRMLLVAQCNALHNAMPFLFGRIDDQTELLLPENLLHSNSPIRKLVQSIDEADWKNVEIIGWIYQFYISEKKDEVIGKVVKSEDIPAATQLFTPNWIVKYMVQNTLGRQWLATYPDSPLKDKMEYYIEPGEQTEEVKAQLAAITPSELDPESITLMDPACGSGHILVEAYDTFKEIYQERGYRIRDIPRLILQKNLYGLEIDDRAAQLASFALLMKARADDRRILDADNPVSLNVLAIQETKGLNVDEIAKALLQERVVEFDSKKLRQQELYPQATGQPLLSKIEKPELSRADLMYLIDQFKEGKTFGSLLTVPDQLKEALPKFERLLAKAASWDAQSRKVSAELLPFVRQADFLSRRYDCVVTNPPYMGGRGLNSRLKAFAQDEYPTSKSDLFAMFIERNLGMAAEKDMVAMITMQSWMFLSSFEKLREYIFENHTILSMAHLGARAFDSIGGEVVSTTAFVLENFNRPEYLGDYLRLIDGKSESAKEAAIREAIQNPNCGWSYRASAARFKNIPGIPIAYWLSKRALDAFHDGKPLRELVLLRKGLTTMDNNRFLRLWYECSTTEIHFNAASSEEATGSGRRWFPINKGGGDRKWYGLNDFLINWKNDGQELKSYITKIYNGQSYTKEIRSEEHYFKRNITWSTLSSSSLSLRYSPPGFLFESKGSVGVSNSDTNLHIALSFGNSKVVNVFLAALSPTLDFNAGPVGNCPVIFSSANSVSKLSEKLIALAKADWDAYETSWDFRSLTLLDPDYRQATLKATYQKLRTYWREMTMEMQRLEEENNRIFIDAYGLQDELTRDVPLSEITLTCNPHYRYGDNKTEEELEALLLTDTMKELISYAVGCMVGRYSLDQPGLVYAHSGNVGFDPSKYSSFPADEDGIVPVMDMDWFPDDATHRFIEFLKVAWPPETVDENLTFVAESLSPKRDETPIDTVRRYFSMSFFRDHLKMYKRRPIYWLFSSGKERAFECLVYLHRYNEATLSRMRGAYVTPLQGKLNARIEYLRKEVDEAGTASARKKLQKELDVLKKKHLELARFDEELRHYADQRITLDLDDGVKVNYGKFGNLLAEKKTVTGQ